MWYFSWILGLSFACSIAILVGIWHELHDDTENLN